jgi:oligogalacturonide lyase
MCGAGLMAAGVLVASAAELPTTWVDKDTGHRVYRITPEPGSSGFYFNVNAYSPDGKLMVYTAPDGIHVFELATKKTRLLVANPARVAGQTGPASNRVNAIVVGRKTNSVFFTQYDAAADRTVIAKADMYSGAVTKLTTEPGRVSVPTINADETLAAGTRNDGPAVAPEYGSNLVSANGTPAAARQPGTLVQPEGKGLMMERRLASRQPLILFTVDLRPGADNGKMTTLLKSTDWVNHLLFSPVDPTLLMYCHEGPWHKVDRIWMIHTDGTNNTLIHKRTMTMEIAGHEFWGLDGRTIWYDWQYPRGEDFFLASYDLTTKKRMAYHLQRNEWSIHFNLTQDLDLFTGDGGDPGQVAKAPDGEWIELFRPEMITHIIKSSEGALNAPDFWQPGVFHSEHLVNMAHHNYKLEPNVRFSPDKTMVFFTSNMFGTSYVFGVEVAKAVGASADEVKSTPELGESVNPGKTAPVPDVR